MNDNISIMINIGNLLAAEHPDLLKLWDYEKNNANNINVNTITCGSNIEAWWRCNKYNHSYKMKINKRVSYGYDCCPYCSGRRVLRGFNDLNSKYPKLVNSEWDYEKNNAIGLKPYEVTSHSSVKAWWHCNTCEGHYEMRIIDKTSGRQGCPYCAGKKVLTGFNDLQSRYPELIHSEWNYEKNSILHINPNMLTCNSSVEACWKCSKCHGEYEMPIYKRTGRNSQGCPFCAGKKILRGFNDLLTCYQDLVNSEWDYEKNNLIGLKPDAITAGSDKKAWWKCEQYGHSWYSSIGNRTILGRGCPKCAHRISKQEDEVAEFIENHLCIHYANNHYTMFRSLKFKRIYEMKKINPNVVLTDDLQSHLLKEIDIYIPELGLAVEYDGDYWHNDKIMMETRGMTNNDARMIKQELCKHAGIKLLFISEHEWKHNPSNIKRMLIRIIKNLIDEIT